MDETFICKNTVFDAISRKDQSYTQGDIAACLLVSRALEAYRLITPGIASGQMLNVYVQMHQQLTAEISQLEKMVKNIEKLSAFT